MNTLISRASAAVVGLLVIAPAAHSYQAGPVTGGGEITGQVAFTGTVPEPGRMVVAKDTGVCGEGEREIVNVAVQDGMLQNAVVYIAEIDSGKAWGEIEQPVLDQKGCRFIPEMLIVRKGGDLTVRNSDPVLHNIHTYELVGRVRRTIFNVGQPDLGDIAQSIRMRRSNFIKVECDAHDFMHAWSFAADNPYVAVTAEDGSFAIGDVPPGEYELKVWHPVLGESSTNVTVTADAVATAEFAFSD